MNSTLAVSYDTFLDSESESEEYPTVLSLVEPEIDFDDDKYRPVRERHPKLSKTFRAGVALTNVVRRFQDTLEITIAPTSPWVEAQRVSIDPVEVVMSAFDGPEDVPLRTRSLSGIHRVLTPVEARSVKSDLDQLESELIESMSQDGLIMSSFSDLRRLRSRLIDFEIACVCAYFCSGPISHFDETRCGARNCIDRLYGSDQYRRFQRLYWSASDAEKRASDPVAFNEALRERRKRYEEKHKNGRAAWRQENRELRARKAREARALKKAAKSVL